MDVALAINLKCMRDPLYPVLHINCHIIQSFQVVDVVFVSPMTLSPSNPIITTYFSTLLAVYRS